MTKTQPTAGLQTEVGSLRHRVAAIQGDMVDTAVQAGEGNIAGRIPASPILV